MKTAIDVLNNLRERSLAELAALPIAELDRLFQHLAVVKDHARQAESVLQAVMNHRYGDCAQKLRERAGKTTGTVRFEEDGFVILADLPKRPEYDQTKLKAAVETLRRWGEDPDDYVGIEIKVSETRYHAWPPGIRKVFEPARTLKTGKPTYKLERVPGTPVGEVA